MYKFLRLIFLNDRFECPPRAVKVSRYAEVCQCVFGILEFEWMPFLPIFLNKIKLHIVRHLRIISYMRAFLQLGLVKLSRMLERPVEAGAPPPKPSHQVRVRPWLLRLSHLTRSRAGLELCWHVGLTLFLAIARFPSDFTITQSPPMLVASGVFGQLSSWRSWPGMRRLTAVWISR